MSEIILWSLLAFFGAFGLVEFVRFVYTDWSSTANDYHVVICAGRARENIEVAVRNAVLATDSKSVIILCNAPTDNESVILKKLQKQYPYVEIMSTEDYIDYLEN